MGSTRLSSELDPEQYHEGIQSYYSATEQIVRDSGGSIGQYLGDGILAYFGYPNASEHDADRAVMAALQMTRAGLGKGFNVTSPPAVRVGVHSGTVVVQQGSPSQVGANLAIGDTTNVAARMQSAAEPNQALISAATRRLLRAAIELKPIGSRKLKGLPVPMELFQVVSMRLHRQAVQTSLECGPLLGRDSELTLLDQFCIGSATDQALGVLVLADAGIGKSRLLAAQKLRATADASPIQWIEMHCSPHASSSAFGPVIDMLRQEIDGAERSEQTAKLGALCPQSFVERTQWLQLVCPLLGLELPTGMPPGKDSPGLRRRKTVGALAHWLKAFGNVAPTILVVEDLHWADALTCDVIGELIDVPAGEYESIKRQGKALRLLISSRPENLPDWHSSEKLHRIQLSGLDTEASRELIRRVPGGQVLPAWVSAAILDRAGGVPLFLEELAKTVLETHDADQWATMASQGSSELLRIPDSLHDSLTARLDRLGPAKSTAQLCAVVGRDFQLELLLRARPEAEARIVKDIRSLTASGLITAIDGSPNTYRFKHALIQDAAYDSMLRATKIRLHRDIATAIEQLFPDMRETDPERLAWHYERADQPDEALEHLGLAVGVAARRSASQQAAAFAKRALEILPRLQDPDKAAKLSVEFQVMRGSQLVSVAGYAHPEVGDAFSKARDAFTTATPPYLKAGVLRGLSVVHLVRAEHEKSLALAEEMRALGSAQNDPMVSFAGCVGSIFPLGHMGRLDEAVAAYRFAEQRYDARWAEKSLTVFSQNLYVAANGYIAIVLWLGGRAQTAEAILRKSETFAAKQSHAFDQAYIQAWYCLLMLLTGQLDRAKKKIDRLLSFAEGNDIFHWIWNGRIQKGLAMALSGEVESGLKLMRDSHAFLQRVGGPIDGPMMYCLEAQVCLKHGYYEAADIALCRGQTIARDCGEQNWDAELWRCRGLLLERAKGDLSGAMAAHEQATVIPSQPVRH